MIPDAATCAQRRAHEERARHCLDSFDDQRVPNRELA